MLVGQDGRRAVDVLYVNVDERVIEQVVHDGADLLVVGLFEVHGRPSGRWIKQVPYGGHLSWVTGTVVVAEPPSTLLYERLVEHVKEVVA